MPTRFCTLIFLCLLAGAGQSAQLPDSAKSTQFHPTLTISRIGSSIKIDGDLSDACWKDAARATGFCETSPGDQIAPSVKSEALMTYDDQNLYVALIAWDNPADIRSSLCDRDRIFRDDYFGVMIDTYGEAAWGYEFFVNPKGIQGDLQILSSGNEEIGFDLIWYSRGLVTDSGYQVEIAIPFSSVRFPSDPVQTWKVNFWRDRQRDKRYQYSWVAQDRANNCFMCQWGTVTGITGIKPSLNFEVLPTVVTTQEGALESSDPRSRFINDDPEAQLSLNLRYGLSTNSSIEGALNPDFSQVESDATQIDVNSATARFYPERRPFFQEGSDLYGTWIDAVHTRSITDPEIAAKFTLRSDQSSVGYFGARDHDTPVLIPLEEATFFGGAVEHSFAQVGRVKRTFGDQSYVGFLGTDRRSEATGSNTVFGLDGSWRLRKWLRAEGQYLAGHTDEGTDSGLTRSWQQVISGTDTSLQFLPTTRLFDRGKHTVKFDGESFWGHAAYASLEAENRHFGLNLDLWETNPTFRADNGFIVQNDRRVAELWVGAFGTPARRVLVRWSAGVNLARVWNFAGTRKDEWVFPEVSVTLPGQTSIYLSYGRSRELFRSVWFDGIEAFVVSAATRPWRWLEMNAELDLGNRIARSFALVRPELGNQTDVYAGVDIRPTSQLRVVPSFNFSGMTFPDSANEVFEAYIVRTQVNYQFTREWFARLIVEYVDVEEYDGAGGYPHDRYLLVEPLISYKFNPFTVFYLGSGHDYWRPLTESGYTRAGQHFFAKLQYLFRV